MKRKSIFFVTDIHGNGPVQKSVAQTPTGYTAGTPTCPEARLTCPEKDSENILSNQKIFIVVFNVNAIIRTSINGACLHASGTKTQGKAPW